MLLGEQRRPRPGGTTLRRDGPLIIAFLRGLFPPGGCALDKGTALAATFEADWAGTPDVTKIHTTRNNTLPFAGTASGTLLVEDGTPAARVTELADGLRRYVARRRAITGRITADAVTFTVFADRSRTDEALALWRSLTADDRLLTGDIHDASTKGTVRWRITLTAATTAGALTLFQDVVTGGERHRRPSNVLSLEVATGRGVRPGGFVGTDFHGALPTGAIAAYEAVAARHAVVHAAMRPDRVSIVVAEDAARADAAELAGAAAPGLAVTVTGAR
ncbi:hypothetical protein FAF44_00865 [Nonomuraea sp. MG754425]|uniref:hypothetical protein n=1 Tax=Nonomuraea sp. MG754425 TaxID=2570319 RepID=UPI001F3CCF2F|nr:hypothetical protein [Nonomuraea sp. MG754425]MCF6466965.1 hypothetical protein [Nonomuraea sp. MG754425]